MALNVQFLTFCLYIVVNGVKRNSVIAFTYEILNPLWLVGKTRPFSESIRGEVNFLVLTAY